MARHMARGSRGTVGQHDFAMIPRAEIPRSVFNRSSSLKTGFNAGYIIPVYVDEVLPGDTMNMNASSFCRMSTPIFPLMDNLYLDWFFFAVPYRLVWNNFEKFNGAQTNPGDSTDYELPRMTAHAVTVGTLSDYMGCMGKDEAASVDYVSLWHRAYNLIYNEWFRDENLQDSVVVDLDDGPDANADYVLLRRGKRHDYFTSCLPFAQKGDPVTLTAAIVGTGAPTFTLSDSGTTPRTLGSGTVGTTAVNWSAAAGATGPDTTAVWADPMLGSALGTINEIREAFQIQRLLERDARGGTRYTEIVRSHFGVISPDSRLQRPEYLGGASHPIMVHPVARTSPFSGAAASNGPPAASLGAFVTTSTDRAGFVKSFTEHCLILGLVNVRADLVYQQGIDRMFDRRTRYDMYWPALAHLGEQAVVNREIFATGVGDPVAGTGDYATFGYQERYAEYRYKPSRTSGAMRSQVAAPLDAWHLGQEFSALPELNEVFIVDTPPMDRVQNVVTSAGNPNFFGDFWFQVRHARPMPTYGVPGLIDHF